MNMNDNIIISNIIGTNVTDAATTASGGLVVNDPMGLCMVAEGTLRSSITNTTTTTTMMMKCEEAYNNNNSSNSNNDSGVYTNIIQLAQQLLFPLQTHQQQQQQQKPSLMSGSTSTTPTTTTTSTNTNTTTTTGSTDDTSPNKPHENLTKNKDIVVVTIEMDDSTIFVSNYTSTSHHNINDYTIALQLPNTISDTATSSSSSQQQASIINDETTITNILLSKDDDDNNSNSMVTEIANEENVQMIGTMSTTINPIESMPLDSTSMTLDQTTTTTTSTTNTMVATTASIMNMDHVE